MGPGTRFQRFIAETNSEIANNHNVKRVVFCSGKVYYDLIAYRDEKNLKNVAIGRVEQISPFPFDEIKA